MLDNLTLFETVFFVIAASSTIILIIQTIFAVIGFGDNDSEIDAGSDFGIEHADAGIDADTDMEGDFGSVDSVDADSDLMERGQVNVHDGGFKLFTVKGIMAFLMMGSWVGFLLSRSGVHEAVAAIFAVISGFIALVLMAKFIQILMSLQSDGTLKIKNALGQIGQVYIRIPENGNGMGKVNVTVQERFCEFDAITEQDEMIKTGENVYITDVRVGNILVVEKVKVEDIKKTEG